MAGAGAKKRIEENKHRVAVLRAVVTGGALAFFAVRLMILGQWGTKASTWHWIGFCFTSALNYFMYTSIRAFAAPVYGQGGELLDGGADLSMKGACAYYHDLLYITSFVQVGASFYNRFWYVYLVVPLYALYKLISMVIVPWGKNALSGNGGLQGDSMDEASRKKLERTEKRAQKRAQKWR